MIHTTNRSTDVLGPNYVSFLSLDTPLPKSTFCIWKMFGNLVI